MQVLPIAGLVVLGVLGAIGIASYQTMDRNLSAQILTPKAECATCTSRHKGMQRLQALRAQPPVVAQSDPNASDKTTLPVKVVDDPQQCSNPTSAPTCDPIDF
jgi:hypothetical protein